MTMPAAACTNGSITTAANPLVMFGQQPLDLAEIMRQRRLARHAWRQAIHVGRGARSTSNSSGSNIA